MAVALVTVAASSVAAEADVVMAAEAGVVMRQQQVMAMMWMYFLWPQPLQLYHMQRCGNDYF